MGHVHPIEGNERNQEALIGPVVRSSASASSPKNEPSRGHGGKAMDRQATVFYVDDNPSSRKLLSSILEARGFAVITAEGPVEALERAKSAEFDVALLDYQMPGMSGTQLARELKRMNMDLPVVVISGLAALPSDELVFVNVHLGSGTRLDQLLETMEMLACRRIPGTENGPVTVRWHDST
jgi:CheY-like chemotaxis protein